MAPGGTPTTLRGRGRRTAAALLGALLLLAGCGTPPSWVEPAAGEVLSGEELLLRMRWLAQSGRLADPTAVLRVTGGRLSSGSQANERLGQYFVAGTTLPVSSAPSYGVPSSARLGPTRNSYSLRVPPDESRACITPADVVRVLGPFREVGPVPFGNLTMVQPLTSAIYRHSAEGQLFTGLTVLFAFRRCALEVSVFQAAPDRPEEPR